MNLIIIGNDTVKIAMDIWKNNTNYCVLGDIKNPYDKDLKAFIKNNKSILVVDTKKLYFKKINSVINYFTKNNIIPIFIADNKQETECKMYHAIVDYIKESVLFIKNENNESYDELLKITKKYMSIKRNNGENDTTIQSPKGR